LLILVLFSGVAYATTASYTQENALQSIYKKITGTFQWNNSEGNFEIADRKGGFFRGVLTPVVAPLPAAAYLFNFALLAMIGFLENTKMSFLLPGCLLSPQTR